MNAGIGGIMGLAVSGGGKKCNIYTANATWVCPGPDTPVRVLVIAGGGGGGGMEDGNTTYPHGAAGGTSSFGALVSAVGGGRGYGCNYHNGRIQMDNAANTSTYRQRSGERVGSSYGQSSTYYHYKGLYSGQPFMRGCSGFIQGKGAPGYMGVGGGGNGSDMYMSSTQSEPGLGGAGGGAGNFAEWEGIVSVNTSVTVGAGGAGGAWVTRGTIGYPGQTGVVVVWWEE